MASVTHMEIALDRTSGVYYAGEVVRGTVTVVVDDGGKSNGQDSTATAGLTCRGVYCRFQGKAKVHWHTGSGDHRHDYDGQTLFQCQYQTLAGNHFYRTPLLDEAGAEADFHVVAHAGVLQIPCTAQEAQHNLQFIVRIMDYDWGKRDDLLGEFVLDVPTLVHCRQVQTYDLQRRGKPEQGHVTLSAKLLPWETVFATPAAPPTSTDGQVQLHDSCLQLTVHKAWDLRKADWIGHNDVYVQVYRPSGGSATAPINPNKALPKPDMKYTLPPGKTVYPFSFAIRTDAPGSAELAVSDYAYIRYSIYANVDKAFWRDPSRKQVITVIPNRPVPFPALLQGPVQRNVPDQMLFGTECCGCKCNKLGLVSVRLQVDRQSYAAGEPITMNGKIESNVSPEPLSIAIVLTRVVTMRTRVGSTRKRQRRIPIWSGTIPPASNSTSTTTTLQQLLGGQNLYLPNTYPSFNGGVNLDSDSLVSPGRTTRQYRRHYACLRWTYMLTIKVTKTRGSGGVEANIPILVSAAPPYAHAIDHPITPTNPPREAGTLSMNIFTHALSTQEHSTTTPRLTGPEDGGIVVQPVGLAAAVSTFDVGDDSGAVGGSNPPYIPMVHAVTVESTATTIPLPVVAAEVEVDTTGQLETLLESLNESCDPRLTVGEWVRDNPLAASQLSPTQVGQILSKVTFTLDQACTALEIAVGLESTASLTCEHVKEALLACPYAKAEVAKSMVTTVRDPENKNVVLDLIDYAFERDDVSRAFVR